MDKAQLDKALDAIHNSASQSETLTTFNEFAAPPTASSGIESKGITGDFMHNGLSGLYSRFRGAVAGSKDKSHSPLSKDDADRTSLASQPGSSSKMKISSSLAKGSETSSAPVTAASTPSSRMQSPTASNFTLSTESPSQPLRGTKHGNTKASSQDRQSFTSITKSTASPVIDPLQTTTKIWHDGAGSDAESRISSLRAPFSPVSVRASQEFTKSMASDVSEGSDKDVDGEEQAAREPRRQSEVPSLNIDRGTRSRSPAVISPLEGLESSMTVRGGTARLIMPEVKRGHQMDRITPSHLPGYHPSRTSSTDKSLAETLLANASTHHSTRHASFAVDDVKQSNARANEKLPVTTKSHGAPKVVTSRLEQMRKQVLSKEFWMADEICKECFLCGDAFTAFRRKHHCRTCGCIFDSKCTSIIPGERFGVHGTLRVCRTCLDVINRRHDSSGSDDSGDDDFAPTSFFQAQQVKQELYAQIQNKAKVDDTTDASKAMESSSRSLATPMMAIPAARRIGDPTNRRSAVLEIDTPQLSRPSSSRSLRSITGVRPQSSSHKRYQSKHNFLTRFRGITEQRAPFHKDPGDERKTSKLPAFHDDNIIDPDLAPYMSDEGSSGDEQMSIFGALNGETVTSPDFESERAAFGSLLSSGRRHRSQRGGEKSINGVSFVNQGADVSGVPTMSHARPSRKRNMSASSNNFHHARASPRHGKTGSVIRGLGDWGDEAGNFTEKDAESSSPRGPSKMIRSVSMRDANAPAVELNSASLHHVKRLLRQLLQDADIPNVNSWEKALIPILLRSTDDVNPDVRGGDTIDIRHYVKLKKIPGGRACDTSYVSGVVFSKNLALKSMSRSISHPRIVLISFPIEYAKHHQHFMSIEPVIAQEPDFLRNMVNRIISLRPHLVLVQKNISGLALQYLSEANVAVAYNVKKSVMEAVSRFTQTEIISSIDMVALKPVHVGKSAGFDVKTYQHNDIPGKKRTYMQISGCPKELGCTIVLRGGNNLILSKMKRITEFMVYVVYNLKLETCLMRDEFVLMPSATNDAGSLANNKQHDTSLTCSEISTSDTPQDTPTGASSKSVSITTATERLQHLQQLDNGFKDISPGVSESATPLPTPAFEEVRNIGQASQPGPDTSSPNAPAARATQDHEAAVPEDIPMPTFYSDMVAKHQEKILSASPFVKFMQPYLLMRAREQERRLVYLKRLRDQDEVQIHAESEKAKPQSFQLIQPEMVHEKVEGTSKAIMEVIRAVHDAEYDKALHNYQKQKRQWEIYIQGNINMFDPYAHQNIVVLYSVVCTATTVPCAGPDIIAFAFYNERSELREWYPDCTLGQFVEDLCTSADDVCDANGCERRMSEHHRTYVHGEARITVFLEKSPCKIKGLKESILMWSYCKICQKETQVMPMSESTWKYSFSKYLELSFWSSGLRLRGGFCPHDLHRDHIRYFGYHNIAMRIHYDPIDLLEIIVPRTRVTWKVDNDLHMKNDLFTKTEERLNRFMNSVKSRIRGINIDSVVPEKVEACRAEVERMKKRAQEEHTALLLKLQEKYTESKYYEIIPLNRAVRMMQEKVAEWDAAFADFDADYFPSEKDIRRLAALQLKKMFMDRDSSTTSLASVEISEPPSDMDHSNTNTDSEVSPTSGPEVQSVLQSVVEEDNNVGSPTALAEEIAPLDDQLSLVDHLDLAVQGSIGSRLSPTDTAKGSDVEGQSMDIDESLTPTPTASNLTEDTIFAASSVRPTPTSQPSEASLSEKILLLRKASQGGNEGSTASELSGIPRPSERGIMRRAGSATSPPLNRTQSQPVSVPRRLPPSTNKSFGTRGETAVSDEVPAVMTEPIKERKLSERLLGTIKPNRKNQSMIPRSIQTAKRKESKVSTLAKHFEQLSREFEKERLRDRRQRAAKVTQSRAFPKASSKPIVEVYRDVDEAVQERGPNDEDLQNVEATVQQSEQTTIAHDMAELNKEDNISMADTTETIEENNTEAETGDEQLDISRAASDDEGITSDVEHSILDDLPSVSDITESLGVSEPSVDLDIPKYEKSSYLKLLTNFWAERSASGWTSLEYPLNATDHVFVDSDVIVREDEPSSLIAFAMSSEDYVSKLGTIRDQGKVVGKSGTDTQSSSDFHEHDQAEVEKSLLRATGTHLKYQFAEGSAKMQCKIFYAEQFDAIRRSCGVGDRIIESLSRCAKWDSKGGKTKSVFLKTLDDRLVLKSLSQIETQAFLRFAPAYFNLMAEALYHDLPTAIAKMLGFYQIVIKNPVTGTEIKWDLLIMENLFYDRTGCRTFDLKGSMRNRKIQSTGQSDEVLLDENMVEYVYENPLFAREHSKKLLRVSVWNDTLFLARQNVMDYSLMVAVDESRKELVVGVIDCIRTYTWDKKLETWIKDRGFAGGNRNRPTVTSPKEYKSRFREAMGRYILQAPK